MKTFLGGAFCFVKFALMKWYFVLVEPAVPENVGAAARAMKTMGFDTLRLVNPCPYSEGKAKWVAHASGEILDQAEVFASLAEAVSDVDFIVASSAKSRAVKADRYPLDNLPEIIRGKRDCIRSVAVVFGREESGLTNSELRLCHLSTYIPMATSYPSLNLSQAVMIYAYTLSQTHLISEPENKNSSSGSKFRVMTGKLEELLSGTKIARNPNIYHRIFERVALLCDDDINLLLSVIAVLSGQINKPENR